MIPVIITMIVIGYFVLYFLNNIHNAVIQNTEELKELKTVLGDIEANTDA